MARTLAEIDADITIYKARLGKLLDPDRAESIKHGDREIRRAATSAAQITETRRALRELQAERARISGDRSPHAPQKV